MRTRFFILVLFAVGFSAAVRAQNYDVTSYFPEAYSRRDGTRLTVNIDRSHGQRFPNVVGAPFSGDMSDLSSEKLTDDPSTMRLGLHAKIWRDSAGRIRVEQPASRGAGSDDYPAIVTICDQVEHFFYALDSQHRIAYRAACNGPLSPEEARALHPPLVPPNPAPNRPTSGTSEIRSQTEPLGKKQFGDVIADGVRRTTTEPSGFEGNDRPIVTSTEIWTSLELKLQVFRKTISPRGGNAVLIRQITNLLRSDPDAALFQIPPGFAVVDVPEAAKSISFNLDKIEKPQ